MISYDSFCDPFAYNREAAYRPDPKGSVMKANMLCCIAPPWAEDIKELAWHYNTIDLNRRPTKVNSKKGTRMRYILDGQCEQLFPRYFAFFKRSVHHLYIDDHFHPLRHKIREIIGNTDSRFSFIVPSVALYERLYIRRRRKKRLTFYTVKHVMAFSRLELTL